MLLALRVSRDREKGKAKNGEQCYLCRDCDKTFGMDSERNLGMSKLPKETWMAYAECFVLMLPLRECARRCRICLKTAYTTRHRLIEGLSAYPPSFKVERGRGCELDETYFPEPFKGNHTKETFTIPPPPDIAASRCTGVDCRVSRSAS